ncbi:MAG: hypothetical protein Q8L01_00610 [Candidatus Woesebacteria bacterium]|nr:hypothetical protein [Candidatus Woesebacteria bacterium]
MRNSRPLYRAVLRDAFYRTLKNKRLWPFGFLAGILFSGSAYDLIARFWNAIVGGGFDSAYQGNLIRLATRDFSALGGFSLVNFHWWFVPAALTILAVLAFLVWLAVVSEGILLGSFAAEEEHKKRGLGALWRTGLGSFRPLLIINLLLAIVTAAAVALAALPLYPAAQNGNNWFVAGAIAAYVILVPAAYLAITAALFTAIEVVRFGESLRQGFRSARRVIAQNWVIIAETSALVLLIDAAVAVAVAIVGAVVSVPFFVLFIAALASRSALFFWLILGLFVAIVTGAIIAVAAAVVTFHYAVWTLLYERLRKGDVTAKVARVYNLFREALRPGR